MRDVVDARADIDERVEARMARHVFHALAIDVDDLISGLCIARPF